MRFRSDPDKMCEGRTIPEAKPEYYSKILSKTSMETEP
jgi:hypothetical protein